MPSLTGTPTPRIARFYIALYISNSNCSEVGATSMALEGRSLVIVFIGVGGLSLLFVIWPGVVASRTAAASVLFISGSTALFWFGSGAGGSDSDSRDSGT